MRKGIDLEVAAGDCALSADGAGTLAIMRTVGCAKATVCSLVMASPRP